MRTRTLALASCLLVAFSLTLSGCTQEQTSVQPAAGEEVQQVQEQQPAPQQQPTQQQEAAQQPETEPVQQQPASPEATYSYQTQELYAQRGENRIYGVVYIPQGAGNKMPAVIFSHGFGGTHAVGSTYAEALAEKGYVVYCFDFCGGSPGSRSDGSTLEMSLFTEQADLEAVISMVRQLDYVDSNNLFLMGSSQGGAVSAITGVAHPDEIRGMVLLYPAFVMVDEANSLFESVQQIPETYYFMWMNVGRVYFEPLLDYDIYGAIAAYDRDVLLIHGDADSIVPLEYSQRALQAYPSAELEVISGAGHGFYGEDAQQAIACMLDYLQAHRV